MKQNIPTQFLQINLANSDEIKNWAERSIRFSDSNKVGLKRSHATIEPASFFASGFASCEANKQANQQANPVPDSRILDQAVAKQKLRSKPGVDSGKPNSTKLPTAGGGTGFASGFASQQANKQANQQAGKATQAVTIIGEITRPDTLNYRTLKPEKDGLFCERIFGPTVDWICSCGQTKERSNFSMNLTDRASSLQSPSGPRVAAAKPIYPAAVSGLLGFAAETAAGCEATRGPETSKGTPPPLQEADLAFGNQLRKPIDLRINNFVGPTATNHERALQGMFPIRSCPVCQVDATTSRFRRYRMGYIGLACPVTHSWYLNSRPNLFSILLKIPAKYIKKIAYYKAYSPSRALPEYLSGLLSPGGDFFDNEWEFLHLWLAGSNSSHDIPAPWMPESTVCRPASSFASCEANQQANQLAGQERGFGLPTRLHGAGAVAKPIYPARNTDPELLRKSHNQNATRLAKAGPSGTPFLFRTMPETPQWLENTGAQALFNQLETRNWINEINRLENQTIQRGSGSGTGFASWFASQQANQQASKATHAAAMVSGSKEANWSRVHREAMPDTAFARAFSEQSGAQHGLRGLEPGLLVGLLVAKQTNKQTNKPVKSRSDEGPLEGRIQHPTPVPSYPPMSKKRKARIRQLKLLKIFQKSGFPTGQMIFSNLPVLPPELRPIIQLGGGRGLVLASSDVNDLYRRVISRNNRLKYYRYETHFVEFLIRSEQQLVQLAVDALIENGKTTQVRHTSGQRRLYKSLSDRIGGKQGRFRMNLLGKRVDYSGRSVIVVGPQLHLQECGLPYEMAIELFQPFVLRHLLELDICSTIRSAKNILRLNKALGRHILHCIIGSHPILLNRAPTLHRLGIQAFQPRLVFGRAIHLHPLVCPAFNADFDGDQMAVHVPLSPSARIEARLLLLSSGAWLQSSTGQPNLLPSQDMVLGFYYATFERYGFQKGKGFIYQSMTEALNAFHSNILDLHSQIWFRSSSSVPPVGGLESLNPAKARSFGMAGTGFASGFASCEANQQAIAGKLKQPGTRGTVAKHPVLSGFVETGFVETGFVETGYKEPAKPVKVTSSEGTQFLRSLWHQTKKFSYITGDSLSRKSTPQKHIRNDKDILAKFTGLLAEYSPVTSYTPDATGWGASIASSNGIGIGFEPSSIPNPIQNQTGTGRLLSREANESRARVAKPPGVDGFEISKNTKAYKFLSRAFDSRISLQCPSARSFGIGFEQNSIQQGIDGRTVDIGVVNPSSPEGTMEAKPVGFQRVARAFASRRQFGGKGGTGFACGFASGFASQQANKQANQLAGYAIRSNSLSKSPEEPIQIRLRSNGISLIIYTSYYWQENSFLNPFSCYIRTTPGRILFNQMIQKYL